MLILTVELIWGLINNDRGKEPLSVCDSSKWYETEEEIFFLSMAEADFIIWNAAIKLRATCFVVHLDSSEIQ